MSPVLYDWIGSDYDATRRADPYLADRLRSHLNPHPDGTYLDIACGTGNYTLALAQRDVRLIGIDQSATMILAAAAKAGPVRWCIGDVRWLPLPDATFHGAICTLAIHHFADLAQSFREVHRVLAPGARWVLFTSTHHQMRGCWLNEYFAASIARSIQQMPDLPVVRSHLQAAGFHIAATEPYDVQPDLQDFFMYSGKHRPAMYLNPKVRAGISTFASSPYPEEIDAGCRRLAADIHTGRIQQVIASYRHPAGDYLFLVAHKA